MILNPVVCHGLVLCSPRRRRPHQCFSRWKENASNQGDARRGQHVTREDTRRLAPVVPVALVILLLTLVILPVQGKVIDRTASFEEPISTGIGGRTLLVEEITATWCPTCAEVDPELMQVADSHGSRIALVALHPTDGEDAFMPPASQHRIERLQTSNPDLQTSTPTFVVEGGEPRIGYDGWQDVQRDILTVELERQQVSELAFEVERTDDGYRATVTHSSFSGAADGQLTFLVLEHHKAMPSGACLLYTSDAADE